MDFVLTVAQLLLAAVFALAGATKLFDLPGSRRAMEEFGLPERAASVAGLLLPLAELAIAAALVLHPTARWSALAAFILLAAFVGGIAHALRRGRTPDCHCFGQVHSAPASRWTLARNAALAVLAAVVASQGPAPAIDAWVAAVIGVALAALAVGLWARRRHERARQERARQRALSEAPSRLDAEPEGLPVGTIAPTFVLPDLQGGTQTLEALRGLGRPVLLQFTDLSCAPCRELLPSVARWQTALADRLTIAVVASASVEDREELQKYGVGKILLDHSGELPDAFRLGGTPTAVGLWPDGTIAAAPAGGLHMPEVLIRILLKGGPAREGTNGDDREAVATAPSALPRIIRYAPGSP